MLGAALGANALDVGALASLQQGYRNNWQQYLASLDGVSARRAYWDVCIITASNDRQAEAYEAQLEVRCEAGLLPLETRFRVIADPDGVRIGSGGATLRVLSLLSQQLRSDGELFGNPFAGKRILIIHSGGDSKRLPHCSATGKLFARVPHQLPDGRPSSLFDEFLVSLSGLPGQIPDGVLVASGDVLLLFDHLQLNLARPGIVGVAAAAPAETGTQHGVYVTGDSSHRVRAFLHKPDMGKLEAQKALDEQGQVPIDTGLVWLDRATASRFLGLAEQLADAIAGGIAVNLYGDLLSPMAEQTQRQAYLSDESDGPAHRDLRAVRRLVWDVLRGTPFSVETLCPASFIHFGTTREYVDVLRSGVSLFRECGWSSVTASWLGHGVVARDRGGDLGRVGGNEIAVNAFVQEGKVSGACLLDTSLETRLSAFGDVLVSNVISQRPTLDLVSGSVVEQLPLRPTSAQDGARFITRVYGLADDPKLALGQGGTLMNMPWPDWLGASTCTMEDLWPHMDDPESRTLWDARLYPVCADRDESMDLALWIQSPQTATAGLLDRWRAAPRLSLGESYVQADVRRLVNEQGDIEDRTRSLRFFNGVERELPASELAFILRGRRDVGGGAGRSPYASTRETRRARRVADQLEASIDPWLPLRGYRALAVATNESLWDDRAFSSLARLVRAHTGHIPQKNEARTPVCDQATVEAGARIDFGGGWTDTPPYSLERGGVVFNAAITLRGKLPILARAERLSEPGLELVSQDLEATLRPRYAGDVLDYANPADPFALHKAALVFRGIVPAQTDPDTELGEVLDYGLRLVSATTIPRGSGLGTSSILAGTILNALSNLFGDKTDKAHLFDEVLCLEQMITTGGGWQDQVGGLVNGIKLVTSQPGIPQALQVEPMSLEPALRQELSTHLVLVYTGQRRLAKDLLRQIMRHWMDRDPDMIAMLGDIAQLAQSMRRALSEGDIDRFGELIARHWEINKRMDPESTNPFIDKLFELCQPFVVGAKLAGAGGGGFMIAILRDTAAGPELSQMLANRYRVGPRIWASEIAFG